MSCERRVTRRIRPAAFLAALVLTLSARVIVAQTDAWESNGPEGGTVRHLAISAQGPLTLYAYADGAGVFRTVDGGANWTTTFNVRLDYGVSFLAVDPQTPTTVYAGGSQSHLLRSTDGGSTWSSAGTYGVQALAIDPWTPTILYAGTDLRLLKSTDGGASWMPTSLDRVSVVDLEVDSQTPTTVYAIARDRGGPLYGVLKSTDGGVGWAEINDGRSSAAQDLVIDPHNPATLYVATSAGVFKSVDAGANWSPVNSGLANLAVYDLAIDPRFPSTLYAVTHPGGVVTTASAGDVFSTNDGGASWSRVDTGNSSIGLGRQALVIDPETSTIYAATAGGVRKSSDGGVTWSPFNTRLIATQIFDLAVDPTESTIYAAASYAGVFKSGDGGRSWSAANTGLTVGSAAVALAIDPAVPITLYAGTTAHGIFKSVDGADWTAASTGLSPGSVSALAIDPSDPTILHAGVFGQGLFRSTDGGALWTEVNVGLPSPHVTAVAIDPQRSATVYAAARRAGILKSIDGGTSWDMVNPIWDHVAELAIDPHTPDILYAATSRGVLKTTDGGASWIAVNSTDAVAVAINPLDPAVVFAGTSYSGVLRSTNGGTTWSEFNSGLTNLSVRALAFSTDAAFAGIDGGGVFARAMPHFTLAVNTSSPSAGIVTFGSGSVTSGPDGINCGSDCSQSYMGGTSVTLTATPAPGSLFTGWDGCDAASDTICTVTLNADWSVTAKFIGIPNLLLGRIFKLGATN